jgi:2-phosphosulfolactate phosphatase
MNIDQQLNYDIRFEWGLQGVMTVANHAQVAIIVDVLSFSTSVAIACSRGATVLPYRFNDDTATTYAKQHEAELANKRSLSSLSLSPISLMDIAQGTRLVLPSLNGATLTMSCTAPVVLAGCLRNTRAVASYASYASYAMQAQGSTALIAAGERWPDGSLRPALEDLIGAGAIIHAMTGRKSPEALVAQAAYLAIADALEEVLQGCVSARELVAEGFAPDVPLALAMDSSDVVPMRVGVAYEGVLMPR